MPGKMEGKSQNLSLFVLAYKINNGMITQKEISLVKTSETIEAQVSRVDFCTGRGQPQKRKGEAAEGRLSVREVFLEYCIIYRILSRKVERYPFLSPNFV